MKPVRLHCHMLFVTLFNVTVQVVELHSYHF